MEPSTEDGGLKWFGEGFDRFPKRLPEDCIEYIIYVINTKLEDVAAKSARLNEILKASSDLKQRLLKDYIWQRDTFELRIVPRSSSQSSGLSKTSSDETAEAPPHLRGRTNFGDSIADEWLIVYLLLELSKQFSDTWIRVYDTDGEFLLIEAANTLPKWLNPEIAENRVWINNGFLRIIALDDDNTSSKNISLSDALHLIERTPERLIISPSMQDEAFYRLREYPSAISSSLHHSLITIPRTLALILHRNPSLISPAIESFYLRDPISLKPLASKDLSTLYFSPEDFVTVSTKFTKVGYAQLRSQIFDPPPAWTGVLPRMGDVKAEMGMKVACGFEMLVTDPQNQNKVGVKEIKQLLKAIESGEETLPTDVELLSWPNDQDDETWLDIDYNDFENELSGQARKKNTGEKSGFGDSSAQENLRKMVSRFEDFMKDDTAGADGIDDLDNDDDDDDDDVSTSASEADKNDDFDDEKFEKAMSEMKRMDPDFIERTGLMEEARRLAVEDAEDASDVDEDEEMRKVMELMEKELKGHGALNLKDGTFDGKAKTKGVQKPVFGPERPPGMLTNAVTKRSDSLESADEEVGPGDGELSSDDDEVYNDVDLGLAKNMLESFKGQVGMAGPAGNLMRSMGVNMPRDAGEEESD